MLVRASVGSDPKRVVTLGGRLLVSFPCIIDVPCNLLNILFLAQKRTQDGSILTRILPRRCVIIWQILCWRLSIAVGRKFPENLNDRKEYRGMVRWFDPTVLLKTAKKVIDSTLFGQYADRRLVHAALDSPINHDTLIDDHCRGAKGLCGDKAGEPMWVDFVADLGDGFDSTYAIAYLIGQKELSVGDLTLPRADCLIMGGDQVYPDASRDEYEVRMKLPYRAAFPYQRNGEHPKLYLIPGNHDWYDGLTLFLANFCRGRATSLGSWIASQRRSYFAVHLGANWWIWGFDSQLGEDIDKPQADYFAAVAEKMEPDAKVILCASVPTWLKADIAGDKKGQEEYYRALHYVANIIREKSKYGKIPLVLSGDLHHYSRYVSEETGTTFVTAGGGGAFLHPTHHLKDKIDAKWRLEDEFDTLNIGTGNDGTTTAFYPPQAASKQLALGNLRFVRTNWKFLPVLGGFYAVCALLMLTWDGYGQSFNGGFLAGLWDRVNILWPTPVFLLILTAFWFGFVHTAEIKSKTRRRLTGFFHAIAHLGTLLLGTALVSMVLGYIPFKSAPLVGDILYLIGFLIGMLIVGIVGGFIWGLYLTIVSLVWGDESNGAFSALALDSYRHFLRLKIEGDHLTIYPIGIDESPQRKDWKHNPAYDSSNVNQNTPAIIPTKDLGYHLIEQPIVIEINKIEILGALKVNLIESPLK